MWELMYLFRIPWNFAVNLRFSNLSAVIIMYKLHTYLLDELRKEWEIQRTRQGFVITNFLQNGKIRIWHNYYLPIIIICFLFSKMLSLIETLCILVSMNQNIFVQYLVYFCIQIISFLHHIREPKLYIIVNWNDRNMMTYNTKFSHFLSYKLKGIV